MPAARAVSQMTVFKRHTERHTCALEEAAKLGVVPIILPADKAMLAVATQMDVADTVQKTPVGVFFGAEPGREVDDPYFGGAGPKRTGCIECGECMIGCRHGAKNKLDQNYLYLAERAGARVHPLTTVIRVRPLPGQHRGGYAVDTVKSNQWFKGRAKATSMTTFTAEQVVFAAGTLGTQRLLHAMRDEAILPNISSRLGELTRTNSESIVVAVGRRRTPTDYTRGVAITSSFFRTNTPTSSRCATARAATRCFC